jgi:hypothetical protein
MRLFRDSQKAKASPTDELPSKEGIHVHVNIPPLLLLWGLPDLHGGACMIPMLYMMFYE